MMHDNRQPSKVTKKDRYGNQITMEYAPDMKPLDPTALAKHAMDQNMEVPEISMMEMGAPEMGHPGEPKGSDTVPAWLTPGEFVVNAEAMRMPGAKQAVEQINNKGRAMQQMQGGSIPSGYMLGGNVEKPTGLGHYDQGGQVPEKSWWEKDESEIPLPLINAPPGSEGNNSNFIENLFRVLGPEALSLAFNQGGQVPFVAGPMLTDPTYQDDGGWITDALLDKLKEVESGGDNEAVSPAGAIGAYQWLPTSAAKAGYGVEKFDPKDEAAARAATKKYLKNMQKHHGFTPEETLRAYNWGPGNVIKHKRGTRKDIPDEALNYAHKILGADKVVGVPAPNAPVPKARPGQQFDRLEDIPKASLPDYVQPGPTPRPIPQPTPRPVQLTAEDIAGLDEDINYANDGGPIVSNFLDRVHGAGAPGGGNIVAPLTDVPSGHKQFGGTENFGGDTQFENNLPAEVPWYNNLLGHKLKAPGTLTDNEKVLADRQTSEVEKLSGPEIAEEENQIADPYTQGTSGITGPEDEIIAGGGDATTIDKSHAEEIVAKPNVSEDKKETAARNLLAKNLEQNSEVDQDEEAGMSQNADKIAVAGDEAAKADPGLMEQGMNFVKEAFGELFDPKELTRMAIMYAGGRALGYSHNGSLRSAAKGYIGRIDAKQTAKVAAAATHDKRVFELTKTDKFTPQSVANYKKTKDPSSLVSKTAVKGAVTTGTTEQRLIGGKKVSIQQVKMANGAIGYNVPGVGVVDKATLENQSKPYDAAFDKNTDKYRARRSRAVKSSTELFKTIQGRDDKYKVDDEVKYNTKINPQQASHDFWTFAEKYGVDPESDEALDLMGSAYQQAIAQSSIEGAPVATDLKPFLENAYIRQITNAPQLFQVNPDKDVKETAKYVRSDKMSVLTKTIDQISATILPNSKNSDARSQVVGALSTDWGNLSVAEKEQWERKANDGQETGFYLFAKEKADQYLLNKKLGE